MSTASRPAPVPAVVTAVDRDGAERAGRIADVDRRFHAFVVDRLVASTVDVAVAVLVARTLPAHGHTVLGVLAVIGTVLLVGSAFALLQGRTGTTPGRSWAGIRLVDTVTGRPIGSARALLRALVLGLAAVPFGLGLAALAWSALADRSRLLRGWHDLLVSSVVLDVRSVPVAEEVPDEPAGQVVNLTALRLRPSHRPGLEPAAVPICADRRARHALSESRTEPVAPQSATWALTLDTGDRVAVDTLLLVGRSPTPRPGEHGARLVTLTSADLSVSRTHLQVVVAADAALVVTDRGSTNGSTLVRKGTFRRLTPGRPTLLLEGDTVLLGDRSLKVEPPQRGRSERSREAA